MNFDEVKIPTFNNDESKVGKLTICQFKKKLIGNAAIDDYELNKCISE